MELDDLKAIWQQHEPSYPAKGAHEIAHMLRGKSNSIVARLIRSVWFELIFTVALAVVLLYFALTLESMAIRLSLISTILLCILYPVYYIKKLKLLSQFQSRQNNLRENIEQLIINLEAYLTFYKKSYAILYPVYFFLGIFFGAMERGFENYWQDVTSARGIVIITISIVCFVALFSFLTKWYMKKLYGNHLDKLKGLLYDLQTSEDQL